MKLDKTENQFWLNLRIVWTNFLEKVCIMYFLEHMYFYNTNCWLDLYSMYNVDDIIWLLGSPNCSLLEINIKKIGSCVHWFLPGLYEFTGLGLYCRSIKLISLEITTTASKSVGKVHKTKSDRAKTLMEPVLLIFRKSQEFWRQWIKRFWIA